MQHIETPKWYWNYSLSLSSCKHLSLTIWTIENVRLICFIEKKKEVKVQKQYIISYDDIDVDVDAYGYDEIYAYEQFNQV